MQVSALNIAAVVTFVILLPELLAGSVKLCKKAIHDWLTRKA
jgi:hypothetical protein